MLGTFYFDQCLNRTGRKNGYVTVEEACGLLVVKETNLIADLIITAQLNGLPINSKQGQMTKDALQIHLNDFMINNSNYAAFTTNDFTYALIKQNSLFYFFDSHAKLLNGTSSDEGVASLRSFNSIELLLNYVLSVHTDQNKYYELCFVSIEIYNGYHQLGFQQHHDVPERKKFHNF